MLSWLEKLNWSWLGRQNISLMHKRDSKPLQQGAIHEVSGRMGSRSGARGLATALTCDLLPENWTARSWKIPVMRTWAGDGGRVEEDAVFGGADRLHFEAS